MRCRKEVCQKNQALIFGGATSRRGQDKQALACMPLNGWLLYEVHQLLLTYYLREWHVKL